MPCTGFIRRLAWRTAGLVAVVLLWAGAAQAQSLESVLAPGKLTRAHAKWEDDCQSCHVRFDRAAQDGRCMDCHKDIGRDVRGKLGFHGRMKPQTCRSCHTEHKGREARIVALDQRAFDHASTDFRLRGKHQKTGCDSCHAPGKKFSAAPAECGVCHRKDDVHDGTLGAKCTDCHTESTWKEARFDHDKTPFPLTGKHADTRCADCHKDKRYKDTPRQCVGCHKKDDDGAKGHKGLYGTKCESCHATKAWKPSSFRHDADTRFALRGSHRTIACTDCHAGNPYKVKLGSDCYSCHKGDDKHKQSLGRDCAACHTERDWKERVRFDHALTRFPLLGKHVEAKCEACHKSAVFKEAPTDCIGCHKKDDRHDATLGEACGSCHVERDWKTTAGRFDHARSRFPLRNAHAAPKLACSACHSADLKAFRKTASDCFSCHKKDDKHEGQQGRQCESCHTDASWKLAKFDHGRTRFALIGRHAVTACKSCHTTPRFKDAPSACVACHKKDDKHHAAFGAACESCHNARAWGLWDFDHDRRSAYKLDGAHRRVACAACHAEPAPAGRTVAATGSNCLACHRKDDAHDGAFGARCEQCHVTEHWKKVSTRAPRGGPARELP